MKTLRKTKVTVGKVPTTNSMKKKELPQQSDRLNKRAQVTGLMEVEAWFNIPVLVRVAKSCLEWNSRAWPRQELANVRLLRQGK